MRMHAEKLLAAVSVTGASVANFAGSMPLEKWAAAAAILSAVLSGAVSLKKLITKGKTDV